MRILFLATLLCVFGLSCENDFEKIEDYKDIPIVYGFISLSDTAQYIRIEKAFVDESISALDLAQNPDSLYYSNAIVELLRNSNGDRFTLNKVDGNLEGYVREEGVFVQSPNYLYKVNTNDIDLVSGETYTLVLDRGNELPLIEASTILLGETRIKSPNPSSAVTLAFDYISKNKFIWQSTDEAAIHDMYFTFNYRERSPETQGQFISKSVLWKVISNHKEDGERVDVETDGINFYTFLRGAIVQDPDAERRFEDMEMIVVSGGEEIQEFVNIGSANLGITSTQDVPIFSNIPDGRGIFSSTNTVILEQINLTNATIDSLKTGIYTKELNFTG